MGNAAKYDYVGDKEIIGLFFQTYENQVNTSWATKVANVFPSNTAVERYAGIGNAPAMREWVGGRLAKSLAEYTMTVTNKDYEATLQAFLHDLRRDKSGQLLLKIQGLALRAAQHDELLLSAIIDGCEAATVLGNAYDGQYFIDTDHSVGDSGTINNDISYAADTGTEPTTTEASKAILAAIQAIYGFKDDAGQPVNQGLKNFMVMVPTSYWATHMTAITKENLASAADNALVGSGLNLEIVQNPRLTWTTKILVLATDGLTKPFLIQHEVDPVFEVIGEGSEYEFQHNARLYGVKKTGAVAYWDFTKACMVTYT